MDYDNGGVGLRTDSVVGIGTTTDGNYNLLNWFYCHEFWED